jgi:tetratricopeptide (TPR) repeat protein
MRVISLASTALVLALAAAPASAQHHDDDHHDAATTWGELDFPTSAAPQAHREFVRGMLYMHNFHYEEAAAAFREAQRLDPGDVMSYWGEAMSYTHPMWDEQDSVAARAVLARLAPTRQARLAKARTPREGLYLEAVETLYETGASKRQRDTAFARAMAHVHAALPDDDEAALFHALALLGQGPRVDSTYLEAAAIAERVFRRQPRHPGAAHYVIHALDDPRTADRGLAAARAYSEIARDAGHAQHMTSHIFVALGMWDDVVRANVQAQRVTGSRFGHYSHWLEYGLLQQGRWADASQWVDSIAAQERATRGTPRSAYSRSYLIAMCAAWVIDTRQWSSPCASTRVDTAELGYAISDNDFLIGWAALHRGDAALADSMAARITARAARRHDEEVGAFGSSKLEMVQANTIRAYRLHQAGKSDEAVKLLREAADLEASLPFAFGPPVSLKPPREALGELLLELDRPADALRELTLALARTPKRAAVLLGIARAHTALGHATDAARVYAELPDAWKNAPSVDRRQ